MEDLLKREGEVCQSLAELESEWMEAEEALGRARTA